MHLVIRRELTVNGIIHTPLLGLTVPRRNFSVSESLRYRSGVPEKTASSALARPFSGCSCSHLKQSPIGHEATLSLRIGEFLRSVVLVAASRLAAPSLPAKPVSAAPRRCDCSAKGRSTSCHCM
jgi:hypothetical protein